MKYSTIVIYVLLCISIFGCATKYEATSVSVKEATDKGKVKVESNFNTKYYFKEIIQTDSVYYGITRKEKISLSEDQISSVYLEDINYFKKNIFYTSIGLGPGLIAANIGYERLLFENKERLTSSFWLRTDGGLVVGPWLYEYTFTTRVSGLLGKSNNYFEYSLGAFVYSTGGISDIQPSGAIGFRYHKRNVILRTGIGVPDLVYFGVGYNF